MAPKSVMKQKASDDIPVEGTLDFAFLQPPKIDSLNLIERGLLLEELYRDPKTARLIRVAWDKVTKHPQNLKPNPQNLQPHVDQLRVEAMKAIFDAIKEVEERKEGRVEGGGEPGKRRRVEEEYEGSAPNSAIALLPLIPRIRALSKDFPHPIKGSRAAFRLLLDILDEPFSKNAQLPAACKQFSEDLDDALFVLTKERLAAESKSWDISVDLDRIREQPRRSAREGWGCRLEKTTAKLQKESIIELD